MWHKKCIFYSCRHYEVCNLWHEIMSAVAIFDNYLTSQDLFKSSIIYLVIIIFKIIITISNVTESILYMYTNVWFKKTGTICSRERPLMTSHIFWPFLTYLPTLFYSISPILRATFDLPTLILDDINGRSCSVLLLRIVPVFFWIRRYMKKFYTKTFCPNFWEMTTQYIRV